METASNTSLKSPDNNDEVTAASSEFIAGLKEALKTSVVYLHYTKKDGSTRVIKATQLPEYIIPYERKTNRISREKPEHILAVWDIEAAGWRSVDVNSVNMVTGHGDLQGRVIMYKSKESN